jgi:hypothetical protein
VLRRRKVGASPAPAGLTPVPVPVSTTPRAEGAASFGTAYFGVRDATHYRADLAAIARQGFEWVVLPFTHDDALWEVTTFADQVAVARDLGLTTLISLWGGVEFGGEGVQGPMSLDTWLERARSTGADGLHVDEPTVQSLTLDDLLDRWGDDGTAWLTIQPNRARELRRSVTRRVAVLGTDAYEGTIDDRVAATLGFATDVGRLDLAWVQAFRILDGEEGSVGEAVGAMAALAPYVGIWGWMGSTGRGVLRSANPGLVQEVVAEAIARVGLTEAA